MDVAQKGGSLKNGCCRIKGERRKLRDNIEEAKSLRLKSAQGNDTLT